MADVDWLRGSVRLVLSGVDQVLTEFDQLRLVSIELKAIAIRFGQSKWSSWIDVGQGRAKLGST